MYPTVPEMSVGGKDLNRSFNASPRRVWDSSFRVPLRSTTPATGLGAGVDASVVSGVCGDESGVNGVSAHEKVMASGLG